MDIYTLCIYAMMICLYIYKHCILLHSVCQRTKGVKWCLQFCTGFIFFTFHASATVNATILSADSIKHLVKHTTSADPEGGDRGSGPPPPPENHKLYGFL